MGVRGGTLNHCGCDSSFCRRMQYLLQPLHSTNQLVTMETPNGALIGKGCSSHHSGSQVTLILACDPSLESPSPVPLRCGRYSVNVLIENGPGDFGMEDTRVAFCQVCMWVVLGTLCKVCSKENLSFSLTSDSPRFIPHIARGPSTESVYCHISYGCGQIPTEKQPKEEGVYFASTRWNMVYHGGKPLGRSVA